MLQRAASNAYSWWWASHIRTKQSKWLEQNLQDMEEKVEMVLKLIEEDGDSFAKRAEMYYKKRPELISFVEESYRAYRALAERYDHISTELQNANNTIASVFPEQVQFAIDEEDEQQQQQQKKAPQEPPNTTNVPIAPTAPAETPKKSLLRKKTMKRMASSAKTVAKSGLEKPEAMLEIDRLQKEILSLQTEKEFVKSSYESGVAQYWEIESLIKEKQDRVSSLQDEFGGEGVVIDDSEARSLMAEAALRSCQHKLALLQERHNTSSQEAMVESSRIKDVRDKLDSLKLEFHSIRSDAENTPPEEDALDQDAVKNLELLRDKIKDQFESKKKNSDASLTVTDMVEKIDELVSKVIGLETAVSSQAALVERLRCETDELQAQIRSLEGDKAVLINGKNLLSNKLKEMEEKLDGILVMDKSFKDQNDNLRVHFTEANCSLGHLSDKLQCVRPDEEETVKVDGDLAQQVQDIVVNPFVDFPTATNPFVDSEEVQQLVSPPQEEDQKEEDDGEPDWQKMFENGMDNKEKTLLTEYTSTLRNYKEVKRKLGEAEKKNRDGASETCLQVKELKSANAKKDEEIRSLRLKLGVLEDSLGSDSFGGFNTGLNLQQDDDSKEEEEEEEEVDIKTLWTGQEQTMSATEEKFRMDIDELLEQNLDFWLRFSSSFHQIQKFDTEVEDLKSEIERLREKRNSDQDGDNNNAFKSDARPLYKHLREIQTELLVWLENSAALKEELECRFSSLCEIQEEITKALKASAEDDDFRFTSHQAAKFQGEVLNMKQENNKVADELQAGLDHIATMQIGVEATLVRLGDEFELAGSTAKKKTDTAAAGGGASSQVRHAVSRSRIPLRSFIFGVRSKKHKASIFACVTPGMSRKYHGLKAGPPF